MPQAKVSLKSFLLKFHPKVNFGGTHQVRLQWEEIVDPVYDMLGVVASHQQSTQQRIYEEYLLPF